MTGQLAPRHRSNWLLPGSPRWPLALAILGIVALGLSTVSRMTPPVGPALPADNEILAYHVEPGRDLVIKIPIEIDAVEATTWAAVQLEGGGPEPPCDSARRFPYGLRATFVNEHGAEISRHDYDLESRVSCDPERPPGEGEYAARLAADGGLVTDPRSTLIVTRDLLPRGGFLRLRAKPAQIAGPDAGPGAGEPVELAVLSRLEGRYRRGKASRVVFEQSLDAAERAQITSGVSALGYEDLPALARDDVLTSWARRLEAGGIEEKDYRISRLFLRRFRTPYPRAAGRGAAEFVIGERHAAALNFRGPVQLDIEGPPGRTVRVADGSDAAQAVVLGPSGRSTVALTRGDIRSVIFDGIGPDFAVRFAAPPGQATAQLGEIMHPPTPDGARLETAPDVRVVRYLTLDPVDPVITRVAPGQELLGLLIRTGIEVSGGVDQGEAALVARWGPGPGQSADLRAVLPRSRFEWWTEGLDSSDPRLAILRIPPGVERIEITGDPRTRIRLRTIEPGVQETLYRIPYRVALAEHETWRYAPFDVSAWADIRAVNLDELERKERFSDLREQVRIERTGEGGRGPGEIPERSLTPEHAPVRRRLLAPAYQSAGEPYPSDAWTPLLVPKDVVVEREGERADRLVVIYRAEPDQLGKDVTLRVDGSVVKTEPIVTLSGTLRAPLPAGAHLVALEGLGASGVAYTDAAPVEGGPIVRRRDVHELTRVRPMTFRFPQHPGETLHLVLFVVTQGENEDFRLRYAIEGVRPASRLGAFFRRVTLPEGELAGRTGDFGKATLWEAATDRRGTDGVARTVIRLGDDLSPGDRVVRLWLAKGDDLAQRVWIGAVLVGQRAPDRASEPRIWVEDE